MSFEYPYTLLLIALFIFGSVFLKLREDAIIFPSPNRGKVKKNALLEVIKWLGITLVVISLASPYKENVLDKNKSPSHSIITILDTSGSMHTIHTRDGDKESTWFDTAKELGVEFLSQRRGDHLGIVLFGTYAYIASPISYDTNSVIEIMKNITGGIAGESTSMYDALFIASNMSKKSEAKQNIAVLISDGMDESSISTLDDAINFVNDANLKVYTIYVGRSLRSTSLQKIAEGSGGKFYYAVDKSALKSVYEDIDRLEKSDLQARSEIKKSYYYQYFLSFGALFLLIYLLLNKKRSFDDIFKPPVFILHLAFYGSFTLFTV